MKKRIFKIVLFIGIFILLFFSIQSGLRFVSLAVEPEKRPLKDAMDFYHENSEKVNVFFVGSSPIYAGISPMAIWGENGITSINLGISDQTAMLSYYQVKNILDTKKPKLIVVDLCSLFESRKADEERYVTTYKKVVLMEPDLTKRFELIHVILSENNYQKPIYYYIPFFQNHNLWTQIGPNIFEQSPSYSRGGLLNRQNYTPLDIPDEYFNQMGTSQIDEYSLSYYEKLFDLCHENDIEVMAINMPKNEMSWTEKRIELCKQVCAQNHVQFIDFNSQQELDNLRLDIKEDYYDQGHMNVHGNFKFSKVLARKLAAMYDLEDHRNDWGYDNWKQDYTEFCEEYKDVIETLSELTF